jgi:hypothetical protein
LPLQEQEAPGDAAREQGSLAGPPEPARARRRSQPVLTWYRQAVGRLAAIMPLLDSPETAGGALRAVAAAVDQLLDALHRLAAKYG